MVRALVVYESASGNTRTVAAAVAAGLGTRITTQLVEAAAAPAHLPAGIDLLVVGGPTEAFGLTRGPTGLRQWLDRFAPLPRHLTAATFDTRAATGKLPRSAARGARRRLAVRGVAVVARPKTFYVDGTDGPPLPGEEQRARAWGLGLAEHLTESRRTGVVS